MEKYAFMAFIHQTASSISPKKLAGRATLNSVVLAMVDIGFAGGILGLTEGGGDGTVGAVVKRTVGNGGFVVSTTNEGAVAREVKKVEGLLLEY